MIYLKFNIPDLELDIIDFGSQSLIPISVCPWGLAEGAGFPRLGLILFSLRPSGLGVPQGFPWVHKGYPGLVRP